MNADLNLKVRLYKRCKVLHKKKDDIERKKSACKCIFSLSRHISIVFKCFMVFKVYNIGVLICCFRYVFKVEWREISKIAKQHPTKHRDVLQ
jgi:hypothetical protein